MIRYWLALVFIIHGMIHLIGFVKAFDYARLSAFTTYISRAAGLAWLLVTLLFLVTAFLYVRSSNAWVYTGIMAVTISQVLILMAWRDARAGTIVNAILLLVILVTMAGQRFDRQTDSLFKEIEGSMANGSSTPTVSITDSLPAPVKRWLLQSKIVAKPRVHTMSLQQAGWMRLKASDTKWTRTSAEQHFNLQEPAFVWAVNMKMFGLLPVKGRDKFAEGKGEMRITLFGLFPIVKQSDEKITAGAMQRFLAEICWCPGAAISPYIQWEPIDDNRARARMTYRGVTVEVIFSFDSSGHVTEVNADRYMGGGSAATLEHWQVTCSDFRKEDGLPMRSTATWKLKEGDFSWYKLEIISIQYR